ncbi:phospholipase D family protein [Oceanobacillus sp. CAU 1775]
MAHRRKKRNLILGATLIILFLIYIATLVYHQTKELPEGVSYLGEEHALTDDDITFLYDLTYQEDGEEVYDHVIFDTIIEMIENAEEFLVVDMFMINDFSDESRDFPKLSTIFYETVKEQLEQKPDLKVVIITDEVNTTYNSHEALHIDGLADYGAEIVYTDLTKLRDPNLLYSGIWRMFFQWFGQEGKTWLANPFGETSPDVTARSYLKLSNIKANHRKAVITENAGLVTSANIHDSSGYHSNVAVKVTGPIIKDMVESERAVAAFSGGDLAAFPDEAALESSLSENASPEESAIQARVVTEKQVENNFIEAAAKLGAGDELWVGMFYLADRTIVATLIEAVERGVDVRLILDPNENAFGSQKMGLPNIPIAQELMERSNGEIEIRWYRTNEEQYHSKIAYLKGQEESYVTLGSTNFTSRNLDNYNLENNIVVTAPNDTDFMQDIDSYFQRIWNNEDAIFTFSYEVEEDDLGFAKYILYWMQQIFRFTTY